MVRNLYIEKSLPRWPMRFARNSTGPGESSRIAVAISSINGTATTPIAIPKVMSSDRLMRRAVPAPRRGSFRDLGSIAAGNA